MSTLEEKIKKKLEKIMLEAEFNPSQVTYWDGCIPEIMEVVSQALKEAKALGKREGIKEGKLLAENIVGVLGHAIGKPKGYYQALSEVLDLLSQRKD